MVVGVISCSSESYTLLGYYIASNTNSAFLIYFAAQAWNEAYLFFCWRALISRSGFREWRSLFSICYLLVWYIFETVGWLRVGTSKQLHLRVECKQWWKFNVLLTVHCDISVQKEPTGCTIYFQFISVINLYMFRGGLLLIIRRIPILPTASQGKRMTCVCQFLYIQISTSWWLAVSLLETRRG
jgi:hypothetical protein